MLPANVPLPEEAKVMAAELFATLPYWSSAFIVTLNAEPAVWELPILFRDNCVAAPATLVALLKVASLYVAAEIEMVCVPGVCNAVIADVCK